MPNLTTDLKRAVMAQSQMVCSAERCHGQGECVTLNGLPACNCMLGYRGDTCMDTVNGGLSIPLTLGFLACVVGFVVLAFMLAVARQRRKRAKACMKQTNGGNGDLFQTTK